MNWFSGANYLKKHRISMHFIETLAAFIMVLVVCVVSVPSILYIVFTHLRYKIKFWWKWLDSFFRNPFSKLFMDYFWCHV